MNYKIAYESNPNRDDINFLWREITQIAIETQGHKPHESFAYFMRDENNKIKAGCNGFIFYGCLYVDQLWVEKSLRGKGYGTQLMGLTENLAKEKRCLFMAVNTMDWEALDFYKKLGFHVEFERHGFEKDSAFYFLRKDL
jgi:ribosomal protein S18 acetylase RimI-like enzyme